MRVIQFHFFVISLQLSIFVIHRNSITNLKYKYKYYFEGKTEKEFRDEFWAEIQKFFNTNVLDKKNKQDITDYLIDYIDRLCLEHVEEVRNEKNVQGAIARLERKPLYHHNKQH